MHPPLSKKPRRGRVAYKCARDTQNRPLCLDFTTRGLLDANTFVVILVKVGPESFKLSTLFPSCRITEIIGRGAVGTIIISYQPLFINKKLRPQRGSPWNRVGVG